MISPCGHDRCVHKGHHSCLPTLRPDGSAMTLTLRRPSRQYHRARKRADFPEVLHTRELGKSAYEAKQMTTAQAVGAVSSEAAEWYAIEWQAIHCNVRRLQVRIVQAVKEGRWGKVKALQRLLTHSYSGKV